MEKIAKMGIVSVLVALFCAIVPATAYADLNGTSTELTGSVEFVGPFHPGSELTAVPHPNEPYEGANFHCTWAVADDRAFTQNVMSIMNGNDPTLNLSEMFEGKYLRCTFTISGVSGELVGTTYQIIHAYWIGSMQHDASFCWMKCPYCDKRFIVEPHSFMTTDEKAATCTEDGLIVKSCSRCHYQSTETIPASGHSYSNDWSSDRDPIGKHALIAKQPPPKMRMTSENGDAWILTLRKGKSSPRALAPFAVMRSGVFFPLHISASIPPTRAQSHRSRRQRGKTAIRASRTRRPKEKAKACLHPPETKARGACSCFWQLRQGRRARRAAQDGGCAIFGADASLHSARQPNGFRRVP